jgi:hypothetical protein
MRSAANLLKRTSTWKQEPFKHALGLQYSEVSILIISRIMRSLGLCSGSLLLACHAGLAQSALLGQALTAALSLLLQALHQQLVVLLGCGLGCLKSTALGRRHPALALQHLRRDEALDLWCLADLRALHARERRTCCAAKDNIIASPCCLTRQPILDMSQFTHLLAILL